MYRHELTDADAQRILAGSVRNNVGTATIFSPWVGAQFAYKDNILCRVSPEGVTTQAIMTQEEAHVLSNEEIFLLVEGK